jgi:hypothetical protein
METCLFCKINYRNILHSTQTEDMELTMPSAISLAIPLTILTELLLLNQYNTFIQFIVL